MADTPPMRVLVITPDYPPVGGGISALVERAVSSLPTIEARVVTIGAEGTTSKAAGRAEVYRVGRKGTGNKLAVAALNAAAITHARRFRPDAVLSAHPVAVPATAWLGRLGRLPVVQYAHANEFRNRPRLARIALAKARAVIAVSRYARDLAVAAGCDEDKLRVIHPGVDVPDSAVVPRRERPTVLTVARLHDAYKGHDTILRALPAVRAAVPDVEWVVIGDGRLRESLEQEAADQGLTGAVRFLGTVSDSERDAWYGRAHVFSMPSRLPADGIGGEGFGIVYLEAAARGLPVVAAAAGGALDAVADRETGILVPADDHDALAQALISLLADPSRARAMGARGSDRARTFSWQRHGTDVERLLMEVAGR